LRAGLAAARRHKGVVLAFYLLSLAPALLLLSVLSSIASPLDRSLEAERILHGEWAPVWIDFVSRQNVDPEIVVRLLPLRWLLTALLGVLLAAGAVEVLLDRRRTTALAAGLGGVARHGGKFLRSAIWFAASLVPVVALFGVIGRVSREVAVSTQDGRWQLAGGLAGLLLALAVYGWLDLGYDLSRLAAATHDDRKTLKGYFRALGAVLRRPWILFFLWWPLFLLAVTPAALYVLLRGGWTVNTGAEVALLFLVQQLVFGLQAVSKTALWGGEIAWYRANGAPRWCAGRQLGVRTSGGSSGGRAMDTSRVTAGRQRPASQVW
jgi:hypothetical protein